MKKCVLEDKKVRVFNEERQGKINNKTVCKKISTSNPRKYCFYSSLVSTYLIFSYRLKTRDSETRYLITLLYDICFSRHLLWGMNEVAIKIITWWGRVLGAPGWGAPMLWWYIMSCFSWGRPGVELAWCFPMSTAARASARLSSPSFRPLNKSPWNKTKYLH